MSFRWPVAETCPHVSPRSLGFDVGGLRVRTSNMLNCYSHVSCSVERRGISQQFQVRTCVVNECASSMRAPLSKSAHA